MCAVTHCICHDTPLSEIQRLAAEQGLLTLDEVVDKLEVGDRCGLCRPYIERLLETDNGQ